MITYDRAGFGRSGLDSSRISLTQQVADLHAGLSKLPGTGRYVLVGHSFGGYCATLFAARYPTQVAKRVHQQFVAAAPNRRLVNAIGSGQYIMQDQPQLLIKTITQFYQQKKSVRPILRRARHHIQ